MASKWCGFGAYRIYLMLLNVFYIAISIFLIALVVIARTFAYQIPSLYVVIGVAVVASILFVLAIIGIVATARHHQVMLFFYMILLGLVGLTLFAVSVAALAVPQEFRENVFDVTWKSLSPKDKAEVQDSLNCCGFNNRYRNITVNESEPFCNVGHPLCITTTLTENCCSSHNKSAVGAPPKNAPFNMCLEEHQCPQCDPCYNLWESSVAAGLKAAGSFGLIFSFTQIFGILLAFRYRNLKDPYVNPREFL